MTDLPSGNDNGVGESSRSAHSAHNGPSLDSSVPIVPAQGGLRDTPHNPIPMRIRRLPSTGTLRPLGGSHRAQQLRTAQPTRSERPTSGGFNPSRTSQAQPEPMVSNGEQGSRRRSFSDPLRSSQQQLQHPNLQTEQLPQSVLPTVAEEKGTNKPSLIQYESLGQTLKATAGVRGKPNRASSAARLAQRIGTGSGSEGRQSDILGDEQMEKSQAYESEVTDFLDVIDPEVSTLTTLNNVQNSLFIPYLGRLYSRQPTYELTRSPTATSATGQRAHQQLTKTEKPAVQEINSEDLAADDLERQRQDGLYRLHTIKSTLSGISVGHNYAVLPHGVRLGGWTDEEKEDLNDHVRHLLHSRREGFKRSMRAFGKYVRKPMGFFVTLYASIITFWGAAWVLFLIGWIHAGNRQAYFVEICDQILTAMLVVFGIGLFPWRVVDTYHMIYIAHYHYKIWNIRRKRGLPDLQDPNDLPDTDPRISTMLDAEAAAELHKQLSEGERQEDAVLSPEQQRKLKYHQDKFAKSHTFFKPHETPTHRAFSIKLLITVVVLLDFHSFFQMALGGTTWGIYYRDRPRALTAVILAFSICCNISSGIIISVGDHKSRKKEVFEQTLRQKRTDEAMKRIEKKRGKSRLKVSKSVEDLEHRLKEMEIKKTLENKEAVEKAVGR